MKKSLKKRLMLLTLRVRLYYEERIKKMAETKSALISVRVYPKELKKVLRLAKKLKMELAEYIRLVATTERDDDLLEKISKRDEMLKLKDDFIRNQELEYIKLFKTAKKATFLVVELSKRINYHMVEDTAEVRRKIDDELKEIAIEKFEIKK